MNPDGTSTPEPQATVSVADPAPEASGVPLLFYASLALPVFAVLIFLMMRIFPGPGVVLEEQEAPSDD